MRYVSPAWGGLIRIWDMDDGSPVGGPTALSDEELERNREDMVASVLSNPLDGERRPGTVGMPLEGVRLRVVDDDGRVVEAGPGARAHGAQHR